MFLGVLVFVTIFSPLQHCMLSILLLFRSSSCLVFGMGSLMFIFAVMLLWSVLLLPDIGYIFVLSVSDSMMFLFKLLLVIIPLL